MRGVVHIDDVLFPVSGAKIRAAFVWLGRSRLAATSGEFRGSANSPSPFQVNWGWGRFYARARASVLTRRWNLRFGFTIYTPHMQIERTERDSGLRNA